MFELQGDLRPLLRDAAVVKGVGKLSSLPNPHQELRLRQKLFAAHPATFARSREPGEIDMDRQILLAGSLVGVEPGGVIPVRDQRPAVPTGKLLVARVTV